MAKNPAAEAKRAKKKHAKEVERKAKQAQARTAFVNPGRPKSHGMANTHHSSISARAAKSGKSFFRTAFHVSFPAVGNPSEGDYTWHLNRVASLDTQDIVQRLHQLGIETDENIFRKHTSAHRCAIEFADQVWLPRLSGSPSPSTEDFVRLAAHELWKRWRQQSPSREMAIEALLQLANHFTEDEQSAVVWGLKLWKFVAPELTPNIRTVGALETKLAEPLGEPLTILLDYFAEAALAVAKTNRDLGREAARVLDEMSAQFQDEDLDWHYRNRDDFAQLQHLLGNEKEAESMLRKLIAGHPERAGAYVALAEILKDRGSEGKRQAIALLEEADAVPVEDGYEYELDEIIEILHKQIEMAENLPKTSVAQMPTPRLVRQLMFAYEDLDDELIEEIKRRGDEALVRLKRILVDDYFWHEHAHDDGLTLHKAFTAIGEIGTVAARQTLEDVLAKFNESTWPEAALTARKKLETVQ